MKWKNYIAAAIAVLALAVVGAVAAEDGKKIYEAHCAACHQITGVGLPPAFPALKGSAIVNDKKNPSEQITLVLFGKAKTAMLPFKHLSDEQLAAVITYVRTSWGNGGGQVTVDQVTKVRDTIS